MEKDLKHISKLLSLVLRHKPEEIGLQLDEHGWANLAELIEKINKTGLSVNKEIIAGVVETNDKQRFSFNEDRSAIRANQGHSIDVELKLEPVTPPDILYHGTADRFVDSIMKTGLQKQSRQHVHLSLTEDTAKAVGSRHGRPAILRIRSKEMHDAGYTFFISENKVWLTEHVPVEFIDL